MRLYQAIYRYLNGVGEVSSALGSGSDLRVYELYAEQNRATEYPLVVCEEVDEQEVAQMNAKATAAIRTMTFTCLARGNPTASNAVAQIIYDALVQRHDEVTGASGLTIHAIEPRGRNHSYEFEMETDEKLFSTILEFQIIHAINE